QGLSGRLAVAAAETPLAAGHVATGARFALALRPNAMTIETYAANLDGGRLTGSLGISRAGSDATATLAAALSGASAERALGLPAAASPLAGTVDVKLDAQGTGRSLAAIVSSLAGAGSISLRDGTIRRLDPAAIDQIEPQVEAGLALDGARIAAALEAPLGRGDLTLRRLSAPFTISGGVARSASLVSRAAAI
ncbi:AsmA-like C-terminal region-containing protein, partial [Hansschlegelia beijingensis]|uniref:AsmA family protein n=1 Tax=Hansschlegelia beijingensis TaxID=1133344 RepID=UPI00387F14CF